MTEELKGLLIISGWQMGMIVNELIGMMTISYDSES